MKSGSKRLFLLIAVIAVIGTGITCGIYLYVTGRYVPRKDSIAVDHVASEYIIQTGNQFEYQKALECSGYAVAYVLRSLGKEVSGPEVYQELEPKNPDGTVEMSVMAKYLHKQGYSATIYTGTLEQLEERVCKGVPVIAFVRVAVGERYYHYISVVGFDQEYIYAADSLSMYANQKDEVNYNRRIKKEDFLKLWKTDVYSENWLYLYVKP